MLYVSHMDRLARTKQWVSTHVSNMYVKISSLWEVCGAGWALVKTTVEHCPRLEHFHTHVQVELL